METALRVWRECSSAIFCSIQKQSRPRPAATHPTENVVRMPQGGGGRRRGLKGGRCAPTVADTRGRVWGGGPTRRRRGRTEAPLRPTFAT